MRVGIFLALLDLVALCGASHAGTIYTSETLAVAEPEVRTWQGRQYLVAPVVMLVAGVHEAEDLKACYSPDELEKSSEKWNEKPIFVGHPHPANQETLRSMHRQIGVLRNTRYRSGELVAEAWIEVAAADHTDLRIVQAIRNEKAMEVSVGFTASYSNVTGQYRTENFDALIRDISPDHLALLPDGQGVCSVFKGCGLLRDRLRFEQPVATHFAMQPPDKRKTRRRRISDSGSAKAVPLPRR